MIKINTVYSTKDWEEYGYDVLDYAERIGVMYTEENSRDIFFIKEFKGKAVSVVPTDAVYEEMAKELCSGVWLRSRVKKQVHSEEVDFDTMFSRLMEDDEMRKHKDELDRYFKWAKGEIEAPDLDAEWDEKEELWKLGHSIDEGWYSLSYDENGKGTLTIYDDPPMNV